MPKMKNGRYQEKDAVRYHKDDLLHREDGPAVERADGFKGWYLHGELHREDGPAVEDADGYKAWYLHGNLHREDGPAVEWAGGTKAWYLHGNLHREDGPAVEYADGYKWWYINGEELTKEEILLAQEILSGKMFKKLPLYINHPKLKYVVKKILERVS